MRWSLARFSIAWMTSQVQRRGTRRTPLTPPFARGEKDDTPTISPPLAKGGKGGWCARACAMRKKNAPRAGWYRSKGGHQARHRATYAGVRPFRRYHLAFLVSLLSGLKLLTPALAQAPGGFTPEEAARRMVVPEGFHVEVFAAEPMVRQPVTATFDERGRLWVI